MQPSIRRSLRSSRPKVISPEVMSPETRVMSPEIYSHVARYLESCRREFQNAQKDSKNARVKCETQVVRFAVVFTEIVNLTKLTKKPNISYSMVLMHLSMLSPRVGGGGGGGRATHGKLTEHAFPWVGILTFKRCPRVGNLTWPPSWKTDRNWK